MFFQRAVHDAKKKIIGKLTKLNVSYVYDFLSTHAIKINNVNDTNI